MVIPKPGFPTLTNLRREKLHMKEEEFVETYIVPMENNYRWLRTVFKRIEGSLVYQSVR